MSKTDWSSEVAVRMQAMESAVRKKKQILLSEEELGQQRARAQAPEKPSLLRRVLQGVRRSGGVQALEQTLAALREEVRLRLCVLLRCMV